MIQSYLSQDTFFNGRLHITQFRDGYRFSIDAILLAAVVCPKPGETVMDLGTGCGIIPLILALRYPHVRIQGIEIQAELAHLAQMNVTTNKLQEQIEIVQADLRKLDHKMVKAPMDWIVSNPPYRRPGSGRINPNAQRATARHEINVNLLQLVRAVKQWLRNGGRFVVIYSAERAIDLFVHMREYGIEPKWVQSIQSQTNAQAKLILVQGIKGAGPGMTIAPPLTIFQPDGSYSTTVQQMLLL